MEVNTGVPDHEYNVSSNQGMFGVYQGVGPSGNASSLSLNDLHNKSMSSISAATQTQPVHSLKHSQQAPSSNKAHLGYNIELFVDHNVAQKYLCSICHHVVSDCHETECGHIFCGGCIGRVLSASRSDDSYKCPFCNQLNIGRSPHKSVYLNRSVKCLKVKCPFHERGCVWVGCLSDLMIEEQKKPHTNVAGAVVNQSVHLLTCKYAPITCDECNSKVARAEYDLHKKQCSKICIHCNAIFSSLMERKLHYQQCPVRVACPHCKQRIKKSELRHHISFLCSSREIKCPFYHFGCHEVVKSANLTKHLKYNATQHYQLKVDHCLNQLDKMRLQMEQQRTEQTELIKQNESLTQQLQQVQEQQHRTIQNESLTNFDISLTTTEQPTLASVSANTATASATAAVIAPDILFLFGSNKWEETGVFIKRSQLHENRVCYTSLRTKCAIRWNPPINAWLIDRRGLATDNEASLIAYQNVPHPGLVTTKWLVYNDDIEEWQQSASYKIRSYNLAEFIFKIDQIFATYSNPENLFHFDSKLTSVDEPSTNTKHNHNGTAPLRANHIGNTGKENRPMPPGLQ